MRASRTLRIGILTLALLGVASLGRAQTFNSGSTGADGALNPPTNVPTGTSVNGNTYTLPLPANGTYNFTTITIGSGITVKFARNATNTPVTLLASGNVTITGLIDLNGSPGGVAQTGTATYSNGGPGGPGGFDGGTGETRVVTTGAGNGLGPGGGKGPTGTTSMACAGGGAGYAASGVGAYTNSSCYNPGYDGLGGPAYGNAALMPLLGGSGGAGGGGLFGYTGGGGGGGAGALLIASSGTLTLTGTVRANGGVGGNGTSGCNLGGEYGGGGSGGGIRLIATSLAGTGGIVQVSGGPAGTCNGYGGTGNAYGSAGRIRIESYSSTAVWTFSNPPSQALPGSVQLPTPPSLTITTVAGVAAPGSPQAQYAAPDIVLPSNTTSPVTVGLAASNIPLGTTVAVTATPLNGAATTATSTGLSGSVASSTATASLAISLIEPSVVTANATFTLIASLGQGPIYAEGEEVTHVRVAASLTGPSLVTYLTKSGREVVLR